jgi:serine-protein kinase ATM
VALGGISKPKIVVCIGSNGSRFKQIVKGHDEIRQDAVMEQVFGYVNELMRRRSESSFGGQGGETLQGNFRVVTYNIVPLSPASGVSFDMASR